MFFNARRRGKTMSEVKYKRVLLKLSGEALQDTQDHQILQATTLKNAA